MQMRNSPDSQLRTRNDASQKEEMVLGRGLIVANLVCVLQNELSGVDGFVDAGTVSLL